ncbi:TPR-containing protein DDB_G0280363-like isoform X2 [Sander lucioperca]|uniref:TPR-containing protein DDB_G0280363-like isoform X2 n=1 Tax=Sander lucioperca TaxID=283035 RepID=UPI00125DD861|nr:TPR-containing protein DDB_G0280363-like isoform X2 [Sander lucioperca]
MDPVRRKSCLRLRGNCPIRKLLRRTYDVPMEETQQNQTHNQTQQTQQNQTHNQTQQNQTHNQTHNQTQGNQTQQTQQNQTQQTQTQGNPEARAVDFMDLDDDVDPETGEKSQG